MTRSDQSHRTRAGRGSPWPLLASAVALLIAGVVTGNGVLVAAGVILAGLVGLVDRR
ncbi:hypothetical protein LZG04_30385 [Saccharothrix sp. S26]|uniref:hypothetical protein n=1 Tax=Saccharothrix sp. S26 TaxID=2907215 RepID=UPI001F1D3494|nr:hypothetical protein [Saccharothrix sp. S26]MCE6999080.1 hypothetical protein [Saccharothrix sp. S26]